jgi:hypothetical protein
MVIMPMLAKEKSLWMPLCDTHHEYEVYAARRKNRRACWVLALGGLIVAVGVAVATVSLQKGEATTDQAWGIGLGSVLLAGLVWGIGAWLIIGASIFGKTRATEITADTITLAGVSGEFVMAADDYRISD